MLVVIVLFGCFRVPRRYCVIRVAHPAAHIHEAAATGVVKCTPAPRMIREARARGNQPADNDVLLQAAQVVLETPDRRLG